MSSPVPVSDAGDPRLADYVRLTDVSLRKSLEAAYGLFVAEGLSNDEIAARLFLSPLTSKTHVSRIMTKLNARDRAQLVVIAYESGLVTPGRRDAR